MPTVEANSEVWGGTYPWSEDGDEWSAPWGGAEMQWYGMLLPRIHRFLPARTILEIAPGFGRWTQFLKDCGTNLTIVDLNENCINACKARFSLADNITYETNDGKSLAMIPDRSVDLIFSFDSLVHAEREVMAGYIEQFPRILKEGGVAFIHHSNFAGAAVPFLVSFIDKIPKFRGIFHRLNLFRDYQNLHWRAVSCSAAIVNDLCKRNGLCCISQELIAWQGKVLNDCISVIGRAADGHTERKILENWGFMAEADGLKKLAGIYGETSMEPGVAEPAGKEA